jgi:CubicO group peptidase (beta-lactamase class C family)
VTPAELLTALLETFDGFLDQPLVIAATVIEGGDVRTAVSPSSETDSFFEFGSIGKTMTAAVLCALLDEGTISLDDPIGSWLAAGPNTDITLRQLATHTSGLPRLAPNQLGPDRDPSDPYATFSDADAEQGLQASERTTVGTQAYSNFGFQLLGLALCRASGLDFESLIRSRLWDPLGMATARVSAQEGRRVQGYHGGNAVPHWHSLLPGPGGMEATAGDLAAYLQAVLDPPDNGAGRAIRRAVADGLAWVTAADGVVWHNGGTAGFHSMMAADVANGRGAAAMANSGDLADLDAAVGLAARGRDPRDARPGPAGPEFDGLALEVAQHMIETGWSAVRARMAPPTAETLTVERLDQAWTAVMGPRGAVQTTRVVGAQRRGGLTEVELELVFDGATGGMRATFDDEQRLVGLGIT